MRLKFEHALLVRTCDVFEIPNLIVFKVFQVGSVRPFFSILLSSSLGESDVLKRPFFADSRSFCLVKSMGGC